MSYAKLIAPYLWNMMQPDFLYCENKEYFPLGIILSTRAPYHIGRIIRHDDNSYMENFIKKYNLYGKCSIIEGYNILIVWQGTLGNIIDGVALGNSVLDAAVEELKKMAEFYYNDKIKGNETRLKKYLRK